METKITFVPITLAQGGSFNIFHTLPGIESFIQYLQIASLVYIIKVLFIRRVISKPNKPYAQISEIVQAQRAISEAQNAISSTQASGNAQAIQSAQAQLKQAQITASANAYEQAEG